MTWKNKHKDTLTLYDYDGNILAEKLFICRGCAIKHAPKTTPACLKDFEGNIVWKNSHYDKIKKKVK